MYSYATAMDAPRKWFPMIIREDQEPSMYDESARENIKLDEMMRVLFGVSDEVIVHLVNGLFGERMSSGEVAIHYGNNEFVTDELDRIRGDVFLHILEGENKRDFHTEFQTMNDGDMVTRMFRYGYEKALELAESCKKGESKELSFPKQLVIFLEENEAIEDHLTMMMHLPDGTKVNYQVPVMKYWTYSIEQLKQNKLYALLPLQVFRSRKTMRNIRDSKHPQAIKTHLMNEEFTILKRTMTQTIRLLNELHDTGEISSSDLERSFRVIQNIAEYLYGCYSEYATINQEVLHMIKTLYDPRVEERGLRKGILVGRQEGIKVGRNDGIEIGRHDGIKIGKYEGRLEVARNLISLGLDMDMIMKSTELTVEEIENLQKNNR